MNKINYAKIKNTILKKLLQTAQKAGIKVKQVEPAFLTFCLEYQGQRHYIYFKKFGLNKTNAILVANKYLTNKILKQAGLKTPKTFLCQAKNDVQKLIKTKQLKYPLVIKPLSASLGTAVTAKINNSQELNLAISRIKKYWQKNCHKRMVFLAEKYIEGNDYRILILNNKVIAVTHRAFPEITGTGQDTVKNLIKKYYQARQYFQKKNKKPLFDHELLRNLKAQKVNLDAILPKGQKIRLRQTANIFGGGMAINMTDKIHAYYKKIALKAAKELDINFTGIDLMTKDISQKGNYAIIEMNSFPSLDMHENPDIGEPVQVTKLILKSIFPNLK